MPSPPFGRRQPSIRRQLFISIASLILLVSLAELGTAFYRTRRAVDRLSRQLFDQTAARVESEMRHLFEPVAGQLHLIRSWAAAGLFDSTEPADLNRVFIPMLESYPQIAAITAATEHVGEYMLLNEGDGWMNRMTPPPGSDLVSRVIQWDRDGMTVRSDEARKLDYDPRTRPWWIGAMEARQAALDGTMPVALIHWTDPYTFYTTKERGITASLAFDTPNMGLVVTALDIKLSAISTYMRSVTPTRHGMAVLYTDVEAMPADDAPQTTDALSKRNVLLLSMTKELELPGLAESASAKRALSGATLEPFRFRNGGEYWWADFRPFDLTPEKRFWTGIFIPERDLMVTGTQQVLLVTLMTLVALVLAVLVAAQVSAQVSAPLRALVAQSGRIARMDLAPSAPVQTRYREMNLVSRAMEDMREALSLQMQAREHTSEELRRSETKYRNLIETSNDIVWSIDREGRLTYLNQAVESVFGQSPASLLNSKFVELGLQRDPSNDEVAFERVMAGETIRGHESERTLPDGRRVALLINATPLRDGMGRVVGATGTAADITELKNAERTLTQTLFAESTYSQKLEEEVARRTQELREKGEALERTVHELRETQDRMVVQEKLASLGSLTAGIAHEIKNPLNFINNFAGLNRELAGELQEAMTRVRDSIPEASRAEIDEAVQFLRDNANKIYKHGRQADNIVQGMLAHSRGRKGDFEPVNINTLIEEHMKLGYHGMRARETAFNASMEYDLDPDLGSVRAIPQDLGRVLLNLINNACFAVYERQKKSTAPYQPIIRASSRDAGTSAEIRIWDNGTGMPPEVADRVFNPFFTTKPAGQGTGLGLSISFDIITREHGGSIAVNTREGEFTEFVITLPKDRARHGA